MNRDATPVSELLALDRRRGDGRRVLRVGPWVLTLDGLDGPLAAALDERWGGFLAPGGHPRPTLRVELFADDRGLALGPWSPGDRYEMVGEVHGRRPVLHSYHIVLGAVSDDPSRWRAAMTDSAGERADRALENGVRYLVARLAASAGGFALHGAGVVRGGRAFVFAGPSGSGKSTAVALSSPSTSLGDDFALVLPGNGGWVTHAVPFDNRERAPSDPPPDAFPVAGVWRLHRADRASVHVAAPARAAAALMSCVAFPWTMPDLADAILEHVRRFADRGLFADLHFARDPGFWTLIEKGG